MNTKVSRPILTVFTPTYNRAHTLPRTYESLCKQSCKDFIWLIIDDGSTDNTKALVDSWQKADTDFEIKYFFKTNGGMHTAHNAAYRLIDTELNVCIDSDDKMADDAVSKIISFWRDKRCHNVAGIIGLNADFNGNIIGDILPKTRDKLTLDEITKVHKISGDKKLVYRTRIIKSVPEYPEFPGEKLVPLGYKYLLVDQKYPLFILNDILCNVEYQPDGSSNTIIKQYFQSPRGFAEARKAEMVYSQSFKRRIKSSIHFVSSNIILKNWHFLSESPKKFMTFCSIPAGFLLYFYLKYINQKYSEKGI
jgi:glycosyltransferase involved in cell wall biosynthesis